MVILVIFDRDNTHSDPEKDQRGCYKLGDIVAVHEDDKHDGDLVANPVMPPWYLIKIPGVTVAQVQHAMESERSAVVLDEMGNPAVIRRRKFRLNINDIPAGARNTLLTDRYLEVTLTQARNYIRNKTTNESL